MIRLDVIMVELLNILFMVVVAPEIEDSCIVVVLMVDALMLLAFTVDKVIVENVAIDPFKVVVVRNPF